MWLLLVLVFIVGPIAELYVIIRVADVIGGWETVALLLVESFIGAWLMKRQGLSAVRRVQRDLQAHRLPATSLADGFLILFAGALLLTPGFLTDALGFLLLIPPTRARIRALLLRLLTARLGVGYAGLRYLSGDGGGRRPGSRRVFDTSARLAPDQRGDLLSDDDGPLR